VFQGEYVLTHSKYPIGAAVMADGVDFGYVGCIYYFAPSLGSLCEKINVGLPWGDTLPNWVKESPPMRFGQDPRTTAPCRPSLPRWRMGDLCRAAMDEEARGPCEFLSRG